MSEVRTKRQNAMLWARITAELLGWPVLIILASAGGQKTLFTLSCVAGEFRCEHSFLAKPQDDEKDDRLSALEKVTGIMAADLGYTKK